MSDERTDASAAFALRLSTDLLTALAATGVLPKSQATALIDDVLQSLLASHPDQALRIREIAAALTTQVSLVSVDLERRLGKP